MQAGLVRLLVVVDPLERTVPQLPPPTAAVVDPGIEVPKEPPAEGLPMFVLPEIEEPPSDDVVSPLS